MPPPRPYWKGYPKLSLVSCPISVYSATSAGERVAFRQIIKQTGNRLRQQLVDEDTGDAIHRRFLKPAKSLNRKPTTTRIPTKNLSTGDHL